jgi:hypothetical protein
VARGRNADNWITASRVGEQERRKGVSDQVANPSCALGCGGLQSPNSTRLNFKMDIV